MSRRPQVLHVTDSVNSRQRNKTYTKNTVFKNVAAIRRSCDISDWETYSVMPSREGDEEGEGDEGKLVEIELKDENDGMVPNIDHTYATINKKKPGEKTATEEEVTKVEEKIEGQDSDFGSSEENGEKFEEQTVMSQNVEKLDEVIPRDAIQINESKDVFEESPPEKGGDRRRVMRVRSSLVETSQDRTYSELDVLREMKIVENKGIETSMSKMNGEEEGSKMTSFIKERSRSLLNLNSEQAEKIRFKKLGSRIENQTNRLLKKRDSNFKTEEPSINRSMPEFLNENFTIENPSVRIQAIENHLEHISKMNNDKLQNIKKTSMEKTGNNMNVPFSHKKVEKSRNCNVNTFVSDKIKKCNNLDVNSHEKVVKSKSNEETNTNNLENFRKVAAFDGLIQYLQDYRLGLRELLVNNNVVIIEPVRESKVRLEDDKGGFIRDRSSGSLERTCRITGATHKGATKTPGGVQYVRQRSQNKNQPKIKRHFFYHPCNKVNRYLVDKELPDPDLVKNGREKYEEFLKLKIQKEKVLAGFGGDTLPVKPGCEQRYVETVGKCILEPKLSLNEKVKVVDDPNKRKLCRFLTVDTVFRDKIIKRWTDSGSLSSGISSDLSCYDTDLESPNYDMSNTQYTSDDDDFDSFNSKNFEVEYHYVAPEVLEKIRACGESTTYYGGRIVASTKGQSPMNCIMNEIKEDTKMEGMNMSKNYLGVKFRLVKSNSCGSRLELTGTHEAKEGRNVEEVSYKTDETSLSKGNNVQSDKPLLNKAKHFGDDKISNNDNAGMCSIVTPIGKVAEGLNGDDKQRPLTGLMTNACNSHENGEHTKEMEGIPKLSIQQVIKEIEAKNVGRIAATQIRNKEVKGSTKDLTGNKEAPKKFEEVKAAEVTTKNEIVFDDNKELNRDNKEEIVVVNNGPNFRGVTPGNRGKNQPPKALHQMEKHNHYRAGGFGAPVCDMEFETFEVLGSHHHHGDVETLIVKTEVSGGQERAGDDIDKDSLCSGDSETRRNMTSWASQQNKSVTFDFRNGDSKVPTANQSSC